MSDCFLLFLESKQIHCDHCPLSEAFSSFSFALLHARRARGDLKSSPVMALGILERCSLHGRIQGFVASAVTCVWFADFKVASRVALRWQWSYEILRPIVVPFIRDRHLMLQHDHAQTHVARSCKQSLEAENIPADSLDMSTIEQVDPSVSQLLPVPSNMPQPLKRSGPTFHRPQ